MKASTDLEEFEDALVLPLILLACPPPMPTRDQTAACGRLTDF